MATTVIGKRKFKLLTIYYSHLGKDPSLHMTALVDRKPGAKNQLAITRRLVTTHETMFWRDFRAPHPHPYWRLDPLNLAQSFGVKESHYA